MLFADRVLRRQRIFPSSKLWAWQSCRRFSRGLTQNSSYEVPKHEDHRFNILFLGRNEFSCLVFQELHRARDVWKGITVVTQPDVRTGRRGEELSVSALKELALKLDHPIYHIPVRRGDFKTWVPPTPFQTSAPPLPANFLLVTASFGRILTPSMLGLFQRGKKLNVHPSLLPKYRGPAPIQWSILGDDKETGVCITEMLRKNEGEGIDGGDLWGIEKVPMPKEPDYKGLIELLGVKGGQLLVSTLRNMLAGKAVAQTQPPGEKTPAPRISPDDVLLDFQTMTAPHIFRIHRAIGHQRPLLTSYLSSWSPSESWNDIQFLDISLPEFPPTNLLASIPGSFVFEKATRSLHVRCAGASALTIGRVKPANGKDMTAEAFWNGLKAKACRAEKRGEIVPDSLMILRSKTVASK